jgi:hypothetical protein
MAAVLQPDRAVSRWHGNGACLFRTEMAEILGFTRAQVNGSVAAL